MSSSRRAWIVVASVGAVEALKDQAGFCRWNYPLRNLAQHTKNNIRSFSQAKKLSSSSLIAKSEKTEQSEESLRKAKKLSSHSSSSLVSANKLELKKAKQSEESLRKVMYLSCWGPN
ncbi:hypothetical protein HAX54_035192 [Datura stramonium]|uniref:Wound-responsive family protein n=1 Tax=Datura stramonium TaxID=4076 RepID=A0ABS8SEZ9_DATST|nr:hypothetical protein [Datura stramonium]